MGKSPGWRESRRGQVGCWWRQGAGLMPGAEKHRAEVAQAPLTGHICTLSSAGKRAMWPSRGPGQELRRGTGEMGGQDESRGGNWGAVRPPDPAISLQVTWSQHASILRVHFPPRPGRHPCLFYPRPTCQMPGRRGSLAGPRGTHLCTRESRWSEVTS